MPFENLSIHLGEPIVLEPAALVDKLVDRRRGGFCYELNGAFAALLSALGYSVTLLAASVATPMGWGDAEVLDTYRTCFGIVLDHLPSPRTLGPRPGWVGDLVEGPALLDPAAHRRVQLGSRPVPSLLARTHSHISSGDMTA